MSWRAVALIACLPLMAVQVAHTQTGAPQPSCAVACRVNPFTAPAGCNCAPSGEAVKPSPADSAPQTTPAPPVVSQPAAPSPASTEPGVPTCELACKVNPFTAPPECDCAGGIVGRGGTGGGAAGPGASTSPEAIAADGMVSPGELLDYMEQLYRARIAGVRNYYFLERMVVGQSPQARVQPRAAIVPASFVQLAVPQTPITGVNTLLTRQRSFTKVDRDGHPAMKEETPAERTQRLVNDPGYLARATPREAAAAKALAKDPAAIFGALGSVADLLAGKGAGDALRKEETAVRAALGKDQQDTDPFAEDVLHELQELKRVQDAEAVRLSGARSPADRFVQHTTGRDTATEVSRDYGRRLYLGHYDRVTRRFTRGPRCASDLACTAQEIWRYTFEGMWRQAIAVERFEDDANAEIGRFVPCMVWRPTEEALAEIRLPGRLREGLRGGSAPHAAELWLPIADRVLAMLRPSDSSDARIPGSSRDPLQGAGNHDRPIRMQVVFMTPANLGFELMILDRVYDDFRPVETSAGPPLFEPHQVRQQIRNTPCEGPINAGEVLEMSVWPLARIGAGDADPEARCAAALDESRVAAVEYLRKEFTANRAPLNPHEEAIRLAEPW